MLGVREESGRPILQTLCTNLKTRKLLLILDNCEHLVQACADLATGILRATPDVQILATSRESLRVPGEQTYAVLPLPVPRRGETLKELLQSTAVRLFVERARQHKPSFAVDEREAPALAELVARLEGIPLALELAAARLRSLALGEINARLQDRYKLLTGGGRALLERQQTLRALVDWSYDLLSSHEQILLQRLSVFAGGCDLRAVEEVCGAEPLAPEDVVDLLASLVDKSLVFPDEDGESTRYRMLETIRDYARDKLIESGDVDAASSRHCNYYFATAKDGRYGLQGPEQAKWIARLEADHDNLRAAIAYSMGGRSDPVIAVKIEVNLQAFRLIAATRAKAATTCARCWCIRRSRPLTLPAGTRCTWGRLWPAGRATTRRRNACSRRALSFAVASATTPISLRRSPHWRQYDCASVMRSGHARVRRKRLRYSAGSEIATAKRSHCSTWAKICAYGGDDADARRFLGQSLALGREIEYSEIESDCELVLGQLALERGDLPDARACLARSLAVCQAAGDTRGTAMVSWWLGKIELASNDGASALPHLREAIRAFESFGMNAETIGVIEDYAQLACSLGLADDSARLYGSASAARERLSLPRPPRLEPLYRDDLGSLHAALTASAFDIAWRDGREWDLAQAVNHVSTLFDATTFRSR